MTHNFLVNISKYLLIFFPIFFITGPFLTDLFGTMIGILLLYLLFSKKKEYLFINIFIFS